MDWFTWLSKTGLDPSLTYEYALKFTHNELVEDDISYFSHEFLQSMGISTAKHRLEILKVASTSKKRRKIDPVLWLVFAMNQTKSYLSKHIHALLAHRRDNLAVSVVPKRSHSLRWKVAMLQRNKRIKATTLADKPVLRNDHSPRLFVDGNNRILMLTNGSPMADSQSSGSSTSSRWGESEAMANAWNSSFSSSTEEIKWDSMFQNLKPT